MRSNRDFNPNRDWNLPITAQEREFQGFMGETGTQIGHLKRYFTA